MSDIQKYVEIVKKEFNQYVSLIFEKEFEKNIFDSMIQKYVDIRYFNLQQNIKDKKALRKVVLEELDKEAKKLRKTHEEEQIANMNEIFSYIMYFDNVGKYNKIENVVDKIVDFRKEKLNINANSSFSKKFLKLVLQNKEIKSNYINKFYVEYFKIKSKRTDNKDVQILKLSYNIPFPKAFSSNIIQEAFDTSTTCEDKLIVEYHMVNAILLENMIKGKFDEQYIVEFTTTLLSKKSKLDRTLKIISNDYQMERVNLLLEYKDFTDDVKSEIYGLMRQGYKIAIRLDETFEMNETDIEKLDVFSYIILDDDLEYAEDLLKNKKLSKKILKI